MKAGCVRAVPGINQRVRRRRRQDAAAAGKVRRVDAQEYLRWTERVTADGRDGRTDGPGGPGGGEMRTGAATISTHLSADRLERLRVHPGQNYRH